MSLSGWAGLAPPVQRVPEPPAARHSGVLARMDEVVWQQSYGAEPIGLPAVYGAVRLISSTIAQLPVTTTRGEHDWLRLPRKYGSALDLYDLVQYVTTSMALRGYGYLLCTRKHESWLLDALHPDAVTLREPGSPGIVRRDFLYQGRPVPQVPYNGLDGAQDGRSYLLHIPYLVTPDHPEGLGPLQAARLALAGYAATERHAATLFDTGTYSGGRLETDQEITATTAEGYQSRWVENRKTGRLPVLGSGLRYVNDIISAHDAQWIEARQFSQAQIWLCYGVPPDYMGSAMSGGGSSLSYQNAQDNDTRFRRNCLAAFTQQLEDALSTLLPPGRNAAEETRVAFDFTSWESAGADSAPDQP